MRPYYEEPGIRLYQGDNREVLEAIGLRPEEVALLWGDPPYGTEGVYSHRVNARWRDKAHTKLAGREWPTIAGDDRPFDPKPWAAYPRAVLWGANYYADRLPASSSWWCWDKKCREWDCDQGDGEVAWTNLGGAIRIFRMQWMGGSNDRVHPTQKPEELATWGFQRAKLQPGDLVLSPWLGSGPEAAAAKRMGLRFVGIELVSEYLDACVDRLRQEVLPL